MDSKADDYDLYRSFSRQLKIDLVTCCRDYMNKTEKRREMIADIYQPQHKQIYKERGNRVEPMQNIVRNIFDLNCCWKRGNDNNRWVFVAMGLKDKTHQLKPYKNTQSFWKMKVQVLG